MSVEWLEPDWPAPQGIRAVSTFRCGGVSQGEFAGLNVGAHVGDQPGHVAENRRLLSAELRLPAEPVWLDQVHGVSVVDAARSFKREADAAWTDRANVPCVVMTADCLPVLLCDASGERVAAVHAGWRGLVAGVIEASVAAMQSSELMAWLGPAIGPDAFEVGTEVRDAFVERDAGAAAAFHPNSNDRWLADIYALARRRLRRCGVGHVYGGAYCTFGDPDRFYSFRRDGRTGRMATLIWRQ